MATAEKNLLFFPHHSKKGGEMVCSPPVYHPHETRAEEALPAQRYQKNTAHEDQAAR